MSLKNIVIVIVIILTVRWWFLDREVVYEPLTGGDKSDLTLSGSEIIGQLQFVGKSSSYSAGHGFVLSHNSKYYVVSASHVYSGSTKNIKEVNILSGKEKLVSGAMPAHIPSFNTCSMEKAKRDVSFYYTSGNYNGGDLVLSPEPAKAGENVWLFCTVNNEGKRPTLSQATVTYSSNKSLKYDFLNPVKRMGSSGCPILNKNRKVVGVNVCLSSTKGVAVPVETISRELKSKVK